MAAKGHGALEPSLLADAATGELEIACVGNPLLRLLIARPADSSSPSRTPGRCRAARQRRPAARPSSSCHMPWALRSPRRRQIPGARSVLHQRPGGVGRHPGSAMRERLPIQCGKNRSLGCAFCGGQRPHSLAVRSLVLRPALSAPVASHPADHRPGGDGCAGQPTLHPGGKQLKWSRIEDQACLK